MYTALISVNILLLYQLGDIGRQNVNDSLEAKNIERKKPWEMERKTNWSKFRLGFHTAVKITVQCLCFLTAVADGNKLRIHLQWF